MLALHGTPAAGKPAAAVRLLAAGRITRGGRCTRLRLAGRSPWSRLIVPALSRLGDLAPG
jgi:hypothetical protein